MAMEVEENGLAGEFAVGARPTKVHFSEQIEVEVIKHVSSRPKHKARRRAKVPKENDAREAEENGEMSPKPVAAYKLKKLVDKDRHVPRSGKGRGQPKKGKPSTLRSSGETLTCMQCVVVWCSSSCVSCDHLSGQLHVGYRLRSELLSSHSRCSCV